MSESVKELLEKVAQAETQFEAERLAAVVASMSEEDTDPTPAPEPPTILESKVEGWRHLVPHTKDGMIPATLKALDALFHAHPVLKVGVLAYDTFLGRTAACSDIDGVCFKGEVWTEAHTTRLRIWLERRNVEPVGRGLMTDYLAKLQVENPTDALLEWCTGLAWDGVARVDRWLVRYLGAADCPYSRLVGRVGLLSQAARAIHVEGCQVDTTPILEGAQGVGKTKAMRILGGAWARECTLDVGDKDTKLLLRGATVVELGELHTMRRGEVDALKAFLSHIADEYRRPYGVDEVRQVRRCVFWGTMNPLPGGEGYFTDVTGNRRFLPVVVTSLAEAALIADRDQLWAEAIARVKAGEAWYITDADEAKLAGDQQEDRMIADPWDEVLALWLDHGFDPEHYEPQHKVTTRDVSFKCFGIADDRMTSAISRRIAAALHRRGWICHRERQGGGKRGRIYVRDVGF